MESKYQVKLEVEIENNGNWDVEIRYKVTDVIFTDLLTRTLDYNSIAQTVRKSIRKMGNFTTLTITASFKESNDRSFTTKYDIISSCRFVNSYSSVTCSEYEFLSNCYPNFLPSDKKKVCQKLKEVIKLANEKYQQLKK